MKTKDKIVSAALELFNQQGERNVTTNHIAAHLGISPGNLYYHYRNKQDIVRAIFTRYSLELLERFTPVCGQTESLSLLKHYLDSIFSLMWKYRFFYSNLPDILRRDRELHREYIQVQQKLRENLVQITTTFIEMNLLQIDKEQMSSFITTLHLIASSWLSYQSSLSPSAMVTEEMINQGMIQMLSVVKPKATPVGLEQFQLLESGLKTADARDDR